MNYYNEFDPKAAAWLKHLIKEGLIPNGEIDTRSIIDVQPADLFQFTQCHFFAGIGGWAYALQLAGWPDDKPVWTGSCPCQPYSTAGKGKGNDDERNLWPHFYRLIKECRPYTVFGEQVAAAIGFGWLDGISTDLEAEGYACGSVVLGAHSVGAPHIRQRLYWVGQNAAGIGRGRRGDGDQAGDDREVQTEGLCPTGGLANNNNTGSQGWVRTELPECTEQQPTWASSSCCGIPDTKHYGSSGADGDGETTEPQEPGWQNGIRELEGRSGLPIWDSYRIAECRDGKYRRVSS